MTYRDVVTPAGNWILTHELCDACRCPSWDAFPGGVVARFWTCQRCGHKHEPQKKADQRAEVSA